MIRNFFRCFCTVFRFAASSSAALTVIAIFTGLTLPLSVFFTERLISSLILFLQNKAVINTVFLNGAILAVIILFMNHVNFISRIFFIYLEKALTVNLSKAILNKIVRINFAAFEEPALHDVLSELRKNPSEKVIGLFKAVRALLVDCIKLFGMVFIFFKISVFLGIGFLFFLILDFFNEIIAVKKIQNIYKEQVYDERGLEDLSNLLSNKFSLVELKIFSAIPFIVKKFKEKYKILLHERISVTLRAYKYNIFGNSLIILWASFLLYILISQILKGNLQIGMFAALITSLTEILNLVIFMSETFWALTDENLSIDFLYEFMNIPDDIHFRKQAEKTVGGEKNIIETDLAMKPLKIRFENVCFSYPNTEKQILNNISFEIEAEHHIALVGKNGSGKSTLIKLIAGLYKPVSGNIFIGDKNITCLSQADIHKAVSIVFQDYANYQMTLRENIALGAIEFLNDDEYLKKVVSLVSSDSVFGNLNLQLGKLEEDGIDFSGGQWQKIAIARALAANSSFIIFDEPTASLDPSAEREMYFNLEKIINNRGCIFISHRLASAKMADKIFVLDKGSIVEEGTHLTLMNAEGLYASMYKSQASWYL
ncbi:ABC transporter ATP-binding protein [Treponema pedis]|uniref:ABC transporter ATP-binding protein n=1 Tax=Treponema pedis TaxID=409322 RepID=UPI000417AFF9